MPQLAIQISDSMLEKLQKQAQIKGKEVEEVVVENLEKTLESEKEEVLSEKGRVEKVLRESGLFHHVTEEEKKRYKPVSEERLKELAKKASVGKPLSEITIEDRGEL